MALKSIPSLLEEELGLSVFQIVVPVSQGRNGRIINNSWHSHLVPPADTHGVWRGRSVVSAAADAEGDGETRSLSPTTAVLKLSV